MTIPDYNPNKKTFKQRIRIFRDILFSERVLDIISYVSGWMGFLICVMILPREINSKIGRIIMYIFFGLFFVSLLWRGIKLFLTKNHTYNNSIKNEKN
jgi:hypothetical protein